MRWSDASAQEPGYLTYQEQLSNPTQSIMRNATDVGKRTLGQVSTHFDVNIGKTLFWSSKAYGNLFQDQRFVTFGPAVAQQERDRNEGQYGALTSLTYHPVIGWLDDFSLETGFDSQQQQNQYQRYLIDSRIRRAIGLRNDEKWRFQNYGGYMQAVIKPFRWLKLPRAIRPILPTAIFQLSAFDLRR